MINGEYVKTDRPEYNWVWSPQGLIYMHMPDLWGLVQFSDKTIESGKVQFKKSEIDIIKWSLRQLYYKQRNYFFKNQKYSKSLKALKIKKSPISGVPWPPKVTLTPSGWEAYVKWNDKKVIIRRDGKVWVE